MNKMGVLGIGHILAIIVLPITIILYIINSYFFRALKFSGNLFLILGIIMILIGTAIIYFSVLELQRAFKFGKLVTDGLYAHTRNPLYAGWILFIIPGIVLILGLIFLIPVPFIAYIIFRILIKDEEKYLEDAYGEKYIEYKKRVNMLIPKIKK
ncbi:MAG: methyltransferase family protein [Thermoplasmata archaeon]